MAVGSRSSVGPWQIAEINVELINEVFRQITDQIDLLRGLTGQNLSVTVANTGAVATGSIVKALTSTTLEAAIAGTDYVAPGADGAISGLTANKIPKAATAKTLSNGSMTDNGSSVACPVLLDLSGIAAGSPNIKIISTTDTPTVTWAVNPAFFSSSTAPAGYLEIQDGANTRYIPFWI
jgi:hypothetical protein